VSIYLPDPMPHRGQRGVVCPEIDYPWRVPQLTAIDPSDGDTLVTPDYPITAVLTALGGHDTAPAKITVNGVECTVANGRLEAYPSARIWGGKWVEDTSVITYYTTARWATMDYENITATVYYGSDVLGSVDFSTGWVDCYDYADTYWTAWALPRVTYRGAEIQCVVYSAWHQGSYDVQFLLDESLAHCGGDSRFYVGTHYRVTQSASGVVAISVVNRQGASGVVQGWRLDRPGLAGVVQGWKIDRSGLSGIVGVCFWYRGQSSGVVGTAWLSHQGLSSIVYGTNRRNVIDIHIQDQTTFDALTAEGITFNS